MSKALRGQERWPEEYLGAENSRQTEAIPNSKVLRAIPSLFQEHEQASGPGVERAKEKMKSRK